MMSTFSFYRLILHCFHVLSAYYWNMHQQVDCHLKALFHLWFIYVAFFSVTRIRLCIMYLGSFRFKNAVIDKSSSSFQWNIIHYSFRKILAFVPFLKQNKGIDFILLYTFRFNLWYFTMAVDWFWVQKRELCTYFNVKELQVFIINFIKGAQVVKKDQFPKGK